MGTIKQRTLMDEAYLKEYSLLPRNFDITEIWNFLTLTEQLHIQPILGDDLYNELLDQVEENDVTPANASLLLAIYPFEGVALVEVSAPYLAMHITEVGITKGKSENSESVNTADMNYLINYIRSQMEPLKKKLLNFLKTNKDLYPSWIGEEECSCTPKIKGNSTKLYALPPTNTDVDGNKYGSRPQFGHNAGVNWII